MTNIDKVEKKIGFVGRLLYQGNVKLYKNLLINNAVINSIVMEKLFTKVSPTYKLDNLAYDKKIEYEDLRAVCNHCFTSKASKNKILKLLDISQEEFTEMVQNKLISCEIAHEKNIEKVKEVYPNFEPKSVTFSVEDFYPIEDKKFTTKDYLNANYQLASLVINMREEELSTYYNFSDTYDFNDNESYFWTHLRKVSGLKLAGIKRDKLFDVDEIRKLEFANKPRELDVNIDREAYFNYLKEKIQQNTKVYDKLTFAENDYKFYINGLYVPKKWKNYLDNPYFKVKKIEDEDGNKKKALRVNLIFIKK